MMKISPSLMCANQLEMMKNIISLLKLGVDMLHFDVVDGRFAKNLALNLDIIRQARKLTRIPFDVHLMVEKPSHYFDRLVDLDVDIIVFQLESGEDVARNIKCLKGKGVKAGLALVPETPWQEVVEYLPKLDYVLVLSVEPGFSGSRFHASTFKKINNIYSAIKARGLDVGIIADGGIRHEHVERLYNAGVDIVVAGTSMLFNEEGFSKNIETYRSIKLDPNKRKARVTTLDSTKTYRAAVLEDVNKLKVQDRELRQLKAGEVLVKVMSSGICGSDLVRVYQKGMYSKNLVPGHEFSGVVVRTPKSGQDILHKRVTVFPLISCGICLSCKTNKYNLCEDYSYLGSRIDGGFAQFVIVPEKNLFILPENVTFDEAALIEPLAVAYRGISKVPNIFNAEVLVLGLGPIGMLSGIMAKRLGAKSVHGIDRNGYKRDIALSAGFNTCSDSGDKGRGTYDLLVECSGSSTLLNMFIPAIKKEGSILLLGNHEENFSLEPKTVSHILRSELTVYSSWNANIANPQSNDWQVCIDMLARKEIDVRPLITHRYTLEDIHTAFEDLKNRRIQAVKVLIKPNKG